MIRWLQIEIEAAGRDFFLMQSNTGSRPLAHVALTRLLGASLPSVEGENLDELFEAMLAFTLSEEGTREGGERRAIALRRAGKESVYSKLFPSHRLSHFVGAFKALPAYRELFSRFGDSSNAIAARIGRETELGLVAADKREYLQVEIAGERYALRLEASNRRFILMPEHLFVSGLVNHRNPQTSKVAQVIAMRPFSPPACSVGVDLGDAGEVVAATESDEP